MIVKIYEIMWAVIALAAAIFLLTGNFTEIVAVVFGFICFGMVFMGMMSVLPAIVAHPDPSVAEAKPREKAKVEANRGFTGKPVPAG
jgi:hypothetical protein